MLVIKVLKIINPSLRCNPKFVLQSIFSRFDWIQSPASSHILVPSKLPMVISKQLSVYFCSQVSLPRNSKYFLQCMINQRTLSSIVQFCKIESICQNIFVNSWIEFLNVKCNKWAISFIGNINKLFQTRIAILKLVERKFWNQFFIDFFNDEFANFAKFAGLINWHDGSCWKSVL